MQFFLCFKKPLKVDIGEAEGGRRWGGGWRRSGTEEEELRGNEIDGLNTTQDNFDYSVLTY